LPKRRLLSYPFGFVYAETRGTKSSEAKPAKVSSWAGFPHSTHTHTNTNTFVGFFMGAGSINSVFAFLATYGDKRKEAKSDFVGLSARFRLLHIS
jgi:hypothetical protein